MTRLPYGSRTWKTRVIMAAAALVGAGVLEAVAFGDKAMGLATCSLGVILGAQAIFARRR